MQYDIFISYKRKGTSSATAAYLYELLLRKGYNVFFDRKEMRSGKFNEQLLEHIAAAKDVIILLEDESLQSWFGHKDDAPRRRIAAPGRSSRGDEPAMSMDMPEEAPYKTDWFCREVMHALSFGQDKNVIPLLLNGYEMPAADDLPPEMKDLAMLQALSLDISEIEETYQKYFVDKEYLKSKPRNLAISRQYQQRGAVVGSFLFYTEAESCELFERGERIITLTDDNDEDHPFCLPVTFAGEHRFRIINNDTCEELRLSRRIEASCQEYIHVEWSPSAPRLWSLSEADIEAQADADTLFRWGRGLFEGTAKNAPDVHRSVLCMERAVAMGHPAACEFVKDHGQGLVTEKSATHEDAFRWYSMSAEMGNAAAQYNLGNFYNEGQGVVQDYAKAVEWFTKSAQQSNSLAQCALGCMHYNGRGVAQDFAKAEQLFRQAAEQDHSVSQGFLGSMYYFGYGVAQDYAEAAELFTKAATADDVQSQRCLGIMYLLGQGVEADYSQGVAWLSKAAEKDDAVAQLRLGLCFLNGNGVEQNNKIGLEWIEKAANNGDDDAQNYLGLVYLVGDHDVEQDYNQAGYWFEKAVEQGHAGAQYNIGVMYDNGQGVTQDYAKAFEWYTKAAEQGYTDAYLYLGNMYFNGRGVEQDHKQAAMWYAKAAEQGSAVAQLNLGLEYYLGQGVEKDIAKAIDCWTQAANKGELQAQVNLGVIYAEGQGVAQDYAKAVEWYTKAAEQGNAHAYNGLAWNYHLMGRYDEALPWAEKAVEAKPDDANVSDTLATVYQGLGRLDEALAEFRRCLELKEAAGAAEDSLAETRAKIAEVEGLREGPSRRM